MLVTEELSLLQYLSRSPVLMFPVFHYLSLSLRYYVAEGVRLYSQETWRVVTQTRGVELVEQHIHKIMVSRWIGFVHVLL